VDADACPGDVKNLLYRTVERRTTHVTVVANQPRRVPPASLIDFILVPGEMNVADRRIVENSTAARPGCTIRAGQPRPSRGTSCAALPHVVCFVC
jgi:hypothetical protein